MEHKEEVISFAVAQDGTKIVTGVEDGNIKLWDIESRKLVKEWAHPESYPQAAISPDDRLVAVADKAVSIYTLEGGQVGHTIKVHKNVGCMCFSPDGEKLACGTHDDICVYDVDDAGLVLGPLKGHKEWVRRVLWSRDGTRLFSASDDQTIRCWNAATGEQIGRSWRGHTGGVYSLSLSPDGSRLASASGDRTVRFWDATTGDPVGPHLKHVEAVITASFSLSGEFVVSAGQDGMVYLWQVPPLNSINDQVVTKQFIYVLTMGLIRFSGAFRHLWMSLTYVARNFAPTSLNFF